ncbi:magnesium/cobalt transporter CorA [Candidatus Woesearchaeota archaeon]|nr:magnesium/cobalt transporter CorA [Candidatus Woesearchaeota archaeon]
MIRTLVLKGNKLIDGASLKQIKKYLKDNKATIWVDLENATDEEFSLMQKSFDFHPLAIEDAKKSIELPKIDVFDRYIYVVLHSVASETPSIYFKKTEIDFFLGNNFLVTFHTHPSPSIEHLVNKLRRNHSINIKTPDFLMYQIIDYFVDLYFPLLDYWEDYVENLETLIISHKNSKKVLKDILKVKREVINLKKSITPQRDVINKLARRDFPYIRKLTSVYFRDVYDHILRVHTEIETEKDLINTAFEAYMSTISNRMATISNKMNQVMQKLTVVATIFMPLTFLTGVYGTNFHYFPEITWKYGYLFFWIAVIIISVLMYLFFRKKKWM